MLNDTTVHEPVWVRRPPLENVRSVSLSWEGWATLTVKSMPSRVLATVRSCMNGLFGSRLRSSQSEQTVIVDDFAEAIPHFFGDSDLVSATTLSFLDPSLSNVSRYYAGSCCQPVHSKSIRDKQVIFSIVFSLSSGAALAVFCFLGAYPTQSFTNSISALAGWNTYCTGMK